MAKRAPSAEVDALLKAFPIDINKLGGLFARATDVVVVYDARLRYLFANKAALSFLGKSAEEVAGRTNHDLFGAEGAFMEEQLKEVLKTKSKVTCIHEVPSPDGPHMFDTVYMPHLDEHGEVASIMGICRDVTSNQLALRNLQSVVEKRKAELERANSQLAWERNYKQALLESSGVVVIVHNDEGRIIDINAAGQRLLGYTAQEAKGCAPWEFMLGPEDAQAVSARFEQLEGNTFPFRKRLVWIHKEGQQVHLRCAFNAIRDDSGKVKVMVMTGIDITEEHHQHMALQVTQATVDSAGEAILWISIDGIISYANGAACQVLGYPREQIVSLPVSQFAADFQMDAWEKGVEKLRMDGSSLQEHRITTARGIRPFQVSANFIETDEEEFICLFMRDITSQIQQQQALLRANREANASMKAKSEFLASMSHEIRTPLNGVIGMNSLLLDTELTREQREMATTIRSSGESLLALINDILDFSKIEAGKMELERVPFAIRQCVEEVGDMFAAKAQEKGIELVMQVGADLPARFNGDVSRIRQILMNLVANAVKFTAEGEVHLRVTGVNTNESAWMLMFAVRDTGIGISKENQARLFQAFTQGDAATNRKYGGTGLGLVICKRLAEAMGGSISCESALGQGATFTVRLPMDAIAMVQDSNQIYLPFDLRGLRLLILDENTTHRQFLCAQFALWDCDIIERETPEEALRACLKTTEDGQPVDLIFINESPEYGVAEEFVRSLRAHEQLAGVPVVLLATIKSRSELPWEDKGLYAAIVGKPAKQSHLFDALSVAAGNKPVHLSNDLYIPPEDESYRQRAAEYRILIVEDNSVNQMVTKKMLENFGYRCHVTANGREALDALSQLQFNLVLMDCQMPEMDGFEATRRQRAREQKTGERVPIVAITAEAMQGDRERCLAAGMDDYLTKPLTKRTLRKMVEKMLDHPNVPSDNHSSKSEKLDAGKLGIDLGFLEDITDGDPEEMKELISLYLEETEQRLNALAKAQEGNSIENLRLEAHTVKGSSANMGVGSLERTASSLELACKNDDTKEMKRRVLELSETFQQVRRYFRELMAGL